MAKTRLHQKLLLALAASVFVAASIRGESDSARGKLAAISTAARKERAQHPYSFRNLEVFDVASPKTIAGAGFIMVMESGKTMAVTVRHPHPDVTPTKFIGQKREVGLGTKIRDADDILTFEVDLPDAPAFHAVGKEGRILTDGDKLSVVCHDSVLSGKLIGINMLLPGQPIDGELQLWVAGKHDLAGNSGAPIVLEETGEVIGVLTGALQMNSEVAIDFAPLASEIPVKSGKAAAPETIFGLAPQGKATGVAEALFRNMLSVELFQIRPGMPMTNLWDHRPFLVPGNYQGDFAEFFGKDYLFRSATFNEVNGKVNKLEFWSSGETPTVERVESMFDWFFAVLGEPSEAFALNSLNTPGKGSAFCRWSNMESVVTVGAYSSGKGKMALRMFIAAPGTRALQMAASTPISPTIESLRSAIHKLTRETAALSTEVVPDSRTGK